MFILADQNHVVESYNFSFLRSSRYLGQLSGVLFSRFVEFWSTLDVVALDNGAHRDEFYDVRGNRRRVFLVQSQVVRGAWFVF